METLPVLHLVRPQYAQSTSTFSSHSLKSKPMVKRRPAATCHQTGGKLKPVCLGRLGAADDNTQKLFHLGLFYLRHTTVLLIRSIFTVGCSVTLWVHPVDAFVVFALVCNRGALYSRTWREKNNSIF